MPVFILRTLIVYLVIIAAMRLMGKKQLGELQPSELVSTILLSNLASIPIESPEIPLVSSILSLLLIVSLEILVSALCTRFRRLANAISGRPKIIVRDGIIDQMVLRELRFTVDDLLASLRAKDVFDIRQVALAMVETNGSISVYKRPAFTEVTRQDLLLPDPAACKPPMPLIVNGALSRAVMDYCCLGPAWIESVLRRERLGIQDILLMLCDEQKDYTIIRKS